MKLFGYKRWYEKEIKKEVNGKEKKYPIKVKVKRENKIIKEDEIGREDKIDNKDFIEALVKYKTRGNKRGNKFSENNILFKMNKNFEIDSIEIIQSKALGKKNKKLADKNNKNKNIYSKNNYSKILNEKKDSFSANDFLEIRENGEEQFHKDKNGKGGFLIELYIDKDTFDEKNKEAKNQFYAIYYKEISPEEKEIKEAIYSICKEINAELFEILKKLSNETVEVRKIRDEFLQIGTENLENIINKLGDLKTESEKYNALEEKQNKDIFGFIYNLFNLNKNKTSNNKKIFSNKIMLFLKGEIEEITELDIKEFLIDEGIHFDILRRKEKETKLYYFKEAKEVKEIEKNTDKIKEIFINTYIKNNKHNSYVNKNYSEKLRESEKIKQVELLISTPNIEDLITEIIEKFKLDELKEKIDSKIKETKRNDVELFGIYKEHYKEKEETIKSWIKEEGEENDEENKRKLLAKLTYRYIKGRIEKIVTTNRKDITNILCSENIVKKVNTRVEQYILENLIYLGKVKILDRKTKLTEENISDKFIEYGIKEELELEFLNFVSATNLYMNELFKTNKDFFGGNGENEKLKLTEYQKGKKIIENRLELSEVELEKYREKMVEIRSAIVHRGNAGDKNSSLFDYYNENELKKDELKESYEKIKKKIEELKVDSKDICKSLNFDIVFDDEKKKELIQNINSIPLGDKDIIYFPNFSKLVPKLENRLRESLNGFMFSNKDFDILKNAFIYLNKVLYYKRISKHKKSEEIKDRYKMAQIKASKGDKEAIRRFQNHFINEYMKEIEKEYKELFNFEYLKNDKNFGEKLKNRKEFEEAFVLNSIEKTIEIKNDFEYIIIVSALIMNDNTYINKFRNRLFSTYSALKSINANNKKSENEKLKLENFQNLIDVLDEVVSINKAKRDYMNEKLWISFNNRNKLEEEIESIVNSFDDKDYIDIMVKHKEKLFLPKILEAVNKISNSKEALGALSEILCKNIEKKEINNYLKTKGLENYNTTAFIQMTKEKEALEKSIKEKEFKNDYIVLRENKENKKLNNLLEKLKDLEEIKEFEEILVKYDKQLTRIKENDKEKKFEEVYYQKNGDLIYKNNIFYYISNKNFELFYEKFLKKDLETVDTEILKNRPEIIKKINDVNKVLTKINSSLKASSKEYKEKFIEGLVKYKSDDNSQKRVSDLENIDKIYNKSKNIFFIDTEFNDYKEFKEAFEEVEKYKKNRAIVEMTIIGKVINYLIEINWKLAMQISRIERDIDYIYTGLSELRNVEENNTTQKPKESLSVNEEIIRRLEKISEYLNSEKDEKGKLSELKNDFEKNHKASIRNYIAHFHLLREPFEDKNLKEIIDEVSKLSEYRTRYNNAVYNSCFEVFKKDFDLNYNNLKKKFILSNRDKKENEIKEFKIKDILSFKKVSILEIETDKSEINTDETLLEKIEKLFEFKVQK